MTQLIRLQLDGYSKGTIQAYVEVSGQQTCTGQLPPPSQLIAQYRHWQTNYLALGKQGPGATGESRRAITPLSVADHAPTTGAFQSNADLCKHHAQQFKSAFNDWLRASDFVDARTIITEAFAKNEDVQFVVCTDNQQLQQLPWTLWDVLEKYSHIEVGISSKDYSSKLSQAFPMQGNVVKILAVLGDSTGIDTDEDRQFLAQLSEYNAEVTFLPTPTRSQLHEHLWNHTWDILFFAGHSSSQGKTGRLRLNATDELPLDDLKNALSRLATRGLTLAIFNSCDGLGLARTLAPLQIPYTIVMRESVPDAVAQLFLKGFLQAFSSGRPFHTAVREARQRLEAGSSQEIPPYGDWMPVIWQNPLVTPPVWPQPQPHSTVRRFPLGRMLLASVGITLGVLGLRLAGGLQELEMNAFDRLLRSRPADRPDQSILVVKITEEEINPEGLASISDTDLEKLLDILYAADPRVIGLDILRDFAVQPGHDNLTQYLDDGEQLITICKAATEPGETEVEPALEANPDGVGFNNIPQDRDLVSRRYLLGMDRQTGKCATDLSFGTLLANTYLNAEGKSLSIDTDAGIWNWGNQTITLLKRHQGGYQRGDMRGDSILLNYRMPFEPDEPVFTEVTVTEILSRSVAPELIRDRIVLIGTDADSIQDDFSTPLRNTSGQQQPIRGVVYHAHAVSQLIDIVLEHRPQLKPLSIATDILLIWVGAVAGSALAGLCQRSTGLLLGNGLTVLGWYGISWIGLASLGLWLPVVPCVISLASGSFVIYLIHISVNYLED